MTFFRKLLLLALACVLSSGLAAGSSMHGCALRSLMVGTDCPSKLLDLPIYHSEDAASHQQGAPDDSPASEGRCAIDHCCSHLVVLPAAVVSTRLLRARSSKCGLVFEVVRRAPLSDIFRPPRNL